MTTTPPTINLDFKVYPKQHQFIADHTRYSAFIGGIGTGKSRSICIKALYKALKNPGSVGCITAPTIPMLKQTTMRSFFEICPPSLIYATNETDKTVLLSTPTGKLSEIVFSSTSEPSSLRGTNLQWAAMDEAAMSDYEAFLILMGRVRAGDPSEQQLFLGTTPRGFNWIYDKFGPHKNEPEYKAFYASTKDNIFLPSDYLHSLERNYSGMWKEQEIEGKFVQHAGLVYDTFSYDKHIGTFPFNESWSVELGWDFGYPNPEAVVVIQRDGLGNVFIIDELYRFRTLTEDVVAEGKIRPWWKNVVRVVCDDSRPDSIQRLVGLGVPAMPAHKGKILDGISKVRQLLAFDYVTQQARLHIDKRCEQLINEFNQYCWMDKRLEEDDYKDHPIGMHDHLLDSLRYWAVSCWQPPSAVKTNKKPIKRRILAYQSMP